MKSPLQIEFERQDRLFDEKVLEKKSVLSRAGIVGIPILFEEIEIKNIQTSCQQSTVKKIVEMCEGMKVELLKVKKSDDVNKLNQQIGHNSALSDILSELNKVK